MIGGLLAYDSIFSNRQHRVSVINLFSNIYGKELAWWLYQRKQYFEESNCCDKYVPPLLYYAKELVDDNRNDFTLFLESESDIERPDYRIYAQSYNGQDLNLKKISFWNDIPLFVR